jgi:SAM-dependent methyltransferase
VTSQFGNPTGPLGQLAGLIMAVRQSNRRRNAWTVEQLDIRPEDRVLEIGYGPGLGIRDAAQRASRGRVVGVDHSALMHRQARRRNRRAVKNGRVVLRHGTLDVLAGEEKFDKAFGVNVVMFWPDPVASLRQLGCLLAPGATIALTMQPRGANVSNEDSDRSGERMAQALRAAGYTSVEVRTLALTPVNAACAIGHWPGEKPD